MVPRNVSHNYFYKFATMKSRLLMSVCIFAFVVISGLALSLLDSTPMVAPQPGFLVGQGRLKLSPPTTAGEEPCEVFSLKGSEIAFIAFEGFGSCKKETLKDVNLEFVNLDAKMFTESLQGCTNLESLTLNKVGLLNENFQRVFLPKLSNYSFDRTIGFHEQYRDYVNYTTPEKLLTILFFDKIQNQSVELKDKILNSKVDIVLRLDGWTVISLQNETELILALNYSNDILKNAKTNYLSQRLTSLTLTECSVSESSIPRHLTYANFYNVGVNDSGLTKIVDSMSSLESLFIEAPKTKILLKNLPINITKIAFSSISLLYSDGDCINATTVALGFISDRKVFDNFHTLFPTVENIAIFEPGSQVHHMLLLNILKTPAKWVLFSNFSRNNQDNDVLGEQASQVEKDIEVFLNELKLPVDERNFLLEKNDQNVWTGRSVDKMEGFELRYKFLGWEKYITQNAYKEL